MSTRPSRLIPGFAVLLATISVAPAQAIPPPPPQHSRYGPVTFCGVGYRIDVGQDEAVGYSQPGYAFLQTDDYFLGVNQIVGPPSGARTQILTVPGIGRVLRYRVFEYPGNRPRGWKYEVPAPGSPSGRISIGSDQFNGTTQDFEALTRVHTGSEANGCAVPSAQDPDFAAAENGPAEGWAPARMPGPAFHCQNGIGFEIREGEALQLPWRHQAWSAFISALKVGDLDINISGPSVRLRGGRGAVFAPPHQAQIRRMVLSESESSFLVVISRPDLDPDDRVERQIVVSFAERPSSDVALSFLHRLQFVGADDPRCRGQAAR